MKQYNSLNSESPDLESLKKLYATNLSAKAVLDEFASRQRNQQKTTLEQLLTRLRNKGSAIAKKDVIDVLRKLEEYGYGSFRNGRRGHPTRFEWKYDLVSVGKAAAGGTQSVKEIQVGEDQDASSDEELPVRTIREGAILHTFKLRPDWKVEIVLPADFSAREASRLSEFVKTLPFDTQP